MRRAILPMSLAAALVVLAGCEMIFSTSFLTSLQREPSNMSLDQKQQYARDALASGDRDAISKAYDALRADALASDDGELELLAARLAMELSGLPDVINELLAGNIDFTQSVAANELALNALFDSLDDAYLADAAAFYMEATDATHGATLGSGDYLIAAIALLADIAGDPADLATVAINPGAADAVKTLTAAGVLAYPDSTVLAELDSFMLAFP